VEIRNLIFEGQTWAVPLVGPANCQGRMLADNILHPSYQQKNALTLTTVQFKSNDSGRIKKGKSNMYDMQQSRCSNISNAVVPGSEW